MFTNTYGMLSKYFFKASHLEECAMSMWIVKGIYELPLVAYDWLRSQNHPLLGSSHLFSLAESA